MQAVLVAADADSAGEGVVVEDGCARGGHAWLGAGGGGVAAEGFVDEGVEEGEGVDEGGRGEGVWAVGEGEGLVN